MIRKRKKIESMRGTKSCGGGSKKKRRGAGNKGGHGNAGMHKGKWTYVVKYDPKHFGKYGFNKPMGFIPITINLKELDQSLEAWVEAGRAEKKKDTYAVDLGALGFHKVLGNGYLTKKVHIKAPYFTEKARAGIEKSGGVAEAPAGFEEEPAEDKS
ncbi:MAG: uL15 family ribosomal protein [Candidatus Undinarchaeales archaeon]|jgi:large subunit ribosomal protein L15|nr:uL15 family ribosomal protein [Candidatus Undinarchaeales archaeon]MDP7493948.1 uL15 family ribosomal protein [Candidatus Undinarchaeales archaeon]